MSAILVLIQILKAGRSPQRESEVKPLKTNNLELHDLRKGE
jgi:hypothetical protein